MNERHLSDAIVQVAADLLADRTGLVIGETRRDVFRKSLQAAMQTADIADPTVYLSRLACIPAHMDELAGRMVIGETYFYRDPAQLDVIRRDILPSLQAERGSSAPMRIWSAACGTGEEPYTLAIMLHEMGLLPHTWLIGTDISRESLQRARVAHYGRWSLRQSDEAFVAQYFQPAGRQFALREDLRASVEFKYLNLVDGVYPSIASGIGAMDLILCRNVFIYFSRDTVRQVADRLLRSLAPHGWLLLGATDPVLSDLLPCDVVVTASGLAYRQRGAGHSAVERRSAPSAEPSPPDDAPLPQTARQPDTETWPDGAPRPQPASVEPARVTTAAPSASQQVLEAFTARDFPQTVAAARFAVMDGGDQPEVWAAVVRAHINMGERAEAERACAEATSRHALAAELHLLHALLLNEVRQYDAAAAAARRALYADRSMVMGHLVHGAALAGAGRDADAGRAFRFAADALELMPPDAVVPASDGEHAGVLAALARLRLASLREEVA